MLNLQIRTVIIMTKKHKKKNKKKINSVILSPIAGFLSLVWVTQFSQFENGILCP